MSKSESAMIRTFPGKRVDLLRPDPASQRKGRR